MAYRSIVRGAARLLLPNLIREFKTAASVLRQLQSQGMGYRKTVFLDDFRTFDSRLNLTGAREAWDKSTPFSDDLIPELFLPQGKRYRAYGWVTYIDPDHEALIRKKITHYTDYRSNQGFYQDEIASLTESSTSDPEASRWIVVDFELLGLEHNRRMAAQTFE